MRSTLRLLVREVWDWPTREVRTGPAFQSKAVVDSLSSYLLPAADSAASTWPAVPQPLDPLFAPLLLCYSRGFDLLLFPSRNLRVCSNQRPFLSRRYVTPFYLLAVVFSVPALYPTILHPPAQQYRIAVLYTSFAAGYIVHRSSHPTTYNGRHRPTKRRPQIHDAVPNSKRPADPQTHPRPPPPGKDPPRTRRRPLLLSRQKRNR